VWMWLSGKPRFGSILAKRPSSNGVRSRRGDESAGSAIRHPSRNRDGRPTATNTTAGAKATLKHRLLSKKDRLTVYLMDGTASYSELLARLVKHTTSRVCVYIKRLSDVICQSLSRSCNNLMST
jgi:hypothetical protein